MTKKYKFLSAAFVLCLSVLMLALKAEAETKVMLSNDDLRTVVANADANNIDIIDLNGQTFNISEEGPSDSSPWVIDNAVTITDGTVILSPGGIILGANVTFDNVTLCFPNCVRNVIAANGHTLTLNNTTHQTGGQQIHLFCGGMSSSSGTTVGSAALPAAGSHGKVIVTGSGVDLGNIYAGSISTDGTYTAPAYPATIEVNLTGTANSIGMEHSHTIFGQLYSVTGGGIYASGALQTPYDETEIFSDYKQVPPVPSAAAYPAGSDVTVKINNGTVKRIDGATGASKNATVIYNDSSASAYMRTLTLNNIGTLNVEAGKLALTASSDLTDTSASVSGSARLIFISMNNPAIKDFTGSRGTVVIAKDQKLTITGAVSGQANVAIDQYNLDESSEPNLNHEYISTADSTADVFTLWPYSANTNIVLVNNNGVWTTELSSATPVTLDSVSIGNAAVTDADYGAAVPVTVSGLSQNEFLSDIPATVKINGSTLTRVSSVWGYTFENDDFAVWFDFDSSDNNILIIDGSGTNGEITAGIYNITIDIPAANMSDSQAEAVNFTLTVTGSAPAPSPLTFTDSDSYNIPASTAGTAITPVNVAPAVSGGSAPYTFSASGLPDGISVSRAGVISGTPTGAAAAGSATVTVTDANADTASITISYGAVSETSAPPAPSQYTVLVNAAPSIGGSAAASVSSATEGDTITITATANNGWYFGGWTVISGNTAINSSTSASSGFTMPAGNVSIQANFKENPVDAYTINVKTAGSGKGSAAAQPQSALSGEKVTLAAVPESGSRFAGWQSEDVTFADSTSASTAFTMPGKSVAVTAVFELSSSDSATPPSNTDTPADDTPPDNISSGNSNSSDSTNSSVSAGTSESTNVSGSSDISAGGSSQTSSPQSLSKIETSELTEVPDSLSHIYGSIEELKSDMLAKAIASSGYTEENTVFFDVKLYFSLDGGATWIETTGENFPADGITVIFPYPENTGKNTHDFIVTHMFTVTSDRLGTVAGDMEQPAVTRLDNGIQVTFKGLSPVAVSWTAAAEAVTAPKTDDNNGLWLWGIALITSAILLGTGIYAKKTV